MIPVKQAVSLSEAELATLHYRFMINTLDNTSFVAHIKEIYSALDELSQSLGERNRNQNLDAYLQSTQDFKIEFYEILRKGGSKQEVESHYYNTLKPHVDLIYDFLACVCNSDVIRSKGKLNVLSKAIDNYQEINDENETSVLEHVKRYTPTWSFIRSIQNNKAVQSTYIWLLILPIFAKFLSKVEDTITIEMYEQVITLDMQLPFTWKALFISALLFTLGNILYLLFCPKIIKENKDYGEFLQKGRDQGHLEEYMNNQQFEEWRRINSSTVREVLPGKRNSRLIEKNITDPGMGSEQEIEKMKALTSQFFWKVHEELDTNRYTVRILETFLYIIAGLIFLYVAAENIIYVIKQF